MSRRFIVALVCAGLAGCGGSAPVPATYYYDLIPEYSLSRGGEPQFDHLVVTQPRINDLRGSTSLVFEEDGAFQQHFYHFWSHAPAEAIWQALLSGLQEAGVARYVSDEPYRSTNNSYLSVTVTRLDRVPQGAGWEVHIALGARFSASKGEPPLLQRTYRSTVAVSDHSVGRSAEAFNVALGEVLLQLYSDLSGL